MPFGCLISFIIAPLIIGNDDIGDEGKQHVSNYVLVSNLITTLCCVPSLIFMREKPPSPPS